MEADYNLVFRPQTSNLYTLTFILFPAGWYCNFGAFVELTTLLSLRNRARCSRIANGFPFLQHRGRAQTPIASELEWTGKWQGVSRALSPFSSSRPFGERRYSRDRGVSVDGGERTLGASTPMGCHHESTPTLLKVHRCSMDPALEAACFP